MPSRKMHDDEIDISDSLVQQLVTTQFPQWAHLPIRPVKSAGTDNAIYRLGTEMMVRLPRISWATEQVGNEQKWLPHLAPHLPLPIPTPLAIGTPTEGYPWNWSIYTWIEGENATIDRIRDPIQMATALAGFITALHSIPLLDGPRSGQNGSTRGVPLIERDYETRAALKSLEGTIDTRAATAAWEEALSAPIWHRDPVWIHGDLQSGNLLAQDGEVCGVIDFGCMGIGDPACDLLIAWNLFTGDARNVFRKALQVDDATWMRGRGWALSVGLIALPYYRDTNPVLAQISTQAIHEVLSDYGHRA